MEEMENDIKEENYKFNKPTLNYGIIYFLVTFSNYIRIIKVI
ncbi:hypothetical protein OOU_Y34scaffold00842g1 [Pyricularia oryzae Y34]|uniref:Uncharacterized protein n=2 Tax=Pyricularia oryzae TaxID=318829 RepID=A0AA97NPI9_PYRO3|nr:hypothetical protein OOU_Y34scaffold00842g1 [Pyricularia oryzae Y34]